MLNFRIKFDPDERFDSRNEIQGIIQGTQPELKETPKIADLEKLLLQATVDYAQDPSRSNRVKKVWAAALLRDCKYGNSKYKFLKGVGLNGLYVENYRSSVRIDSTQ